MIYNLSKLINKYYNPLIQAGYKELYLSRFIYLKFNTYNSSPITSSNRKDRKNAIFGLFLLLKSMFDPLIYPLGILLLNIKKPLPFCFVERIIFIINYLYIDSYSQHFSFSFFQLHDRIRQA